MHTFVSVILSHDDTDERLGQSLDDYDHEMTVLPDLNVLLLPILPRTGCTFFTPNAYVNASIPAARLIPRQMLAE